MKLLPIAVLTFGAGAFAALGAAMEDVRNCSVAFQPFGPFSTQLFALATPLSDSVLAGDGAQDPQQTGGHRTDSRPDRPVYAQVFAAEAIGHSIPTHLEGLQGRSLRADGSRRIAIVVWDYDAGCEPAKWGDSFVWAPAGQRLLVLQLHLRPAALWADGIPTFDTFYGGTLYEPRWYPDEHSDVVPASTVFTLLRSLPSFCSYHRDPQQAAAQLSRLAAAYSEFTDVPSVAEVFAIRREWVKDALAGIRDPMFSSQCTP